MLHLVTGSKGQEGRDPGTLKGERRQETEGKIGEDWDRKGKEREEKKLDDFLLII